MSNFYTGIGSSAAPLDILELSRAIAKDLSLRGWSLHSGGDEGFDRE